MIRDLRFGLRILRRHPSYACAAIAVMALGVGATTAVFSVLRGVLITPLPYPDPSRLVLFRSDLPGVSQAALTSAEFAALRDRPDLFEGVAALVGANGSLTAPEDLAPLNAVAVSETLLPTLGVVPALGRALKPGDSGAHPSINLAWDVWQRHFHGDPGILGRDIEVNGGPMTVVGILPRGFRAYLGSKVALPTQVDVLYYRGRGYDDDPFRGNVVVARLRRGVRIETARAAVDAIAKNVVAGHPSEYRTGAVRLSIARVEDEVVRDVRPALMAAAGAVAFVLIVACANLTNLLLARASARTREMSVRIAIGASRADIVRQLLAEGAVVGAIGAAGGWMLAQWGVDGLLQLAPASLPRRDVIGVDATVALFAIALASVCALAVSVVPAWHATRTHVGGGLKVDAARAGGVARGALVAAQIALSVMLLVGAGLMARAFVSLRSVPLGFEPRNAAALFISVSGARFGSGTIEQARERRRVFYTQAADQVRDIPGVRQVGVGFPVPLDGTLMSQRVSLGPGTPVREAEGFTAMAGYLDALDVPLVAGRRFARGDDQQSAVIVDEMLAAALWPGRPYASAVGERLMIVTSLGDEKWAQVVGVVAHIQSQGLRGASLPQVWMSHAVRSYAQLNMVVRAGDPMGAIPQIARLVQQGSGRPIRDVKLLEDSVSDATADTRFALFVFGVFAALAVVLAAVGIYGVVAYAMATRTREIAVRVALGASPHRLVALVLRDGALWVSAGLATGLTAAAMLTRYLEVLLFKVGPHDATTFLAVTLLLAGVALAASIVPALGAVRVDPMRALRNE